MWSEKMGKIDEICCVNLLMFLCLVIVVVFQKDHFRFRLRFGNFFLWHFRNWLMSPGFDTFLQICCDLAWLNQGFRKRYDSINLRHQIWSFICFEKGPLIKQQHSLSNLAFRLPVLKCLLSNLWPLTILTTYSINRTYLFL